MSLLLTNDTTINGILTGTSSFALTASYALNSANASASSISYNTLIGDGVNKIYNVTHSLNTSQVIYSVFDTILSQSVNPSVTLLDSNHIRLGFYYVASSSQYNVTVSPGALIYTGSGGGTGNYVVTASGTTGNLTASFSLLSISSSFSQTSSISYTSSLSNTSSYSLFTTKGSGSFTGSFLGTCSYAINALTASYAINASGSLIGTLTGSLNGTASFSVSSSYAATASILSSNISGQTIISSSNDVDILSPTQIYTNAPFVLMNASTGSLTTIGVHTQAGAIVYCTNFISGSQPVYFNGTHWYTYSGILVV